MRRVLELNLGLPNLVKLAGHDSTSPVLELQSSLSLIFLTWMMTMEARALFYSIKHFADSPEWANFNDAYEKGKTFYASKASNQNSGYSVTL